MLGPRAHRSLALVLGLGVGLGLGLGACGGGNGTPHDAAPDMPPNLCGASDVFFPNVGVDTGPVAVSVAGGAIGTGSFTLEGGKMTYLTVVTR